MEKSQSDLCFNVLKQFAKRKLLDKIILIGSWCLPFYKQYFSGIEFQSTIKTRDLDFLLPNPSSFKYKADIPSLLKSLGFVLGFKGSKGYIILQHPDLIVEFLVIEKGKGFDEPIPFPNLGVNATALRFLNFLTMKTIKVIIDNITVTLPHPANFALHKLIIAQRRRNSEKKEKDFAAAINVIEALIEKKEEIELRKAFFSIPKKWQDKINKGLKELGEEKIIELINNQTA
ncbi:hypothetical protein HZB07_01130 [Candidatus Saganbacteria bacterium]|nr:hypothetical protein [Candidatus Saganbacteria bacterium]